MAKVSKRQSEPVFDIFDDGAKKVFDHKPGRDVIDDFLSFVQKTGKPHEWPNHLHYPPPTNASPVILTEFVIPERLRGRVLMAPCPMCRPRHPKYWFGMLAWFEEERAIRAIGSECGHEFLEKGVFARALERYKRDTARQQELEFLIRNLPLVQHANEVVRILLPRAAALDQIRGVMRLVVSRTCAKEIHRAAGDHRSLQHIDIKKVPVVSKEGGFRTDKDGNIVMRNEPVVVGSFPLHGSEALVDILRSAKADLITAEALLRDLETRSEDDIMSVLSVFGDDGLSEPVLRMRRAWVMMRGVVIQLAQAAEFLDPENISNLGSWGASHRAFRRMIASYEKNGSLKLGELGRNTRTIPISGLLRWPLPALSDLAD